MAQTTHLKITKPVSEHDAQKIATLNTEADDLDNAIGGMLALSVAGSSNVILTRAQALNAVFKFTGVLTGNIVVSIPVALGYRRDYTVWNATTGAFTLTMKTTAGTVGPAVTQTKKVQIFHDGVDVYASSAEV